MASPPEYFAGLPDLLTGEPDPKLYLFLNLITAVAAVKFIFFHKISYDDCLKTDDNDAFNVLCEIIWETF